MYCFETIVSFMIYFDTVGISINQKLIHSYTALSIILNYILRIYGLERIITKQGYVSIQQ